VRREFTSKTKREEYKDAGGRCRICHLPIKPGQEDYDHVIPDAIGGKPRASNCALVHRDCHREKTVKEDIPRIAKSRRIRNREAGIRKKSKFATSRDGPFKKKINGEVVRR